MQRLSLLIVLISAPTLFAWGGPAMAGGDVSDVDQATLAEAVDILVEGAEPEAPEVPLPELAPLFKEGSLADAKRAFDAGKYAAARRLIDESGDGSRPAQLLRALADFEGQKWRAAAEAFEALLDESDPMVDFVRLHAGKARLNAGETALAIEHLSAVSEGSAWRGQAQRTLARVLIDEKQHDRALEVLATFDDAGTLLQASEVARAKGDRELAKRLLLEVWSQHPTSGAAWRAERKLSKRDLTAEARARRADRLTSAYRHSQARREAVKVLRQAKLPDNAACLASLAIGRFYRTERRHADAIATLKPVVAQCTDPDVRVRALYVLASSQSIIAEEDGRVTYAQLAAEFSNHDFADDALFYAADLDFELGDVAQGRKRLELLTEKYPQGDYALDGAFWRFWSLWTEGELDTAREAIAAFEATARAKGRNQELAQAKYWAARLEGRLGDTVKAQAQFAQVVADHPGTLYASWALQRLDATTAVPPPSNSPDVIAGLKELATDSNFLAALQLTRMGLPSARTALRAVDLTQHSPDASVALVHALVKAGDERIAVRISEARLEAAVYGPLDDTTRPLWDAHRPRPFQELIERESTRAGLSADLLRGLIHRESGFSPKARSGVGARGLMQVMPPTARMVARELGVKLRSESQLHDAALNVKLGSHYLSSLVDRFEGRLELAVAAYNGGPTRVARWWGKRSSDEVDEFVENIPIGETRRYVKRVLGDYAAYRMLGRTPVVASATPKSSDDEG